jgi:hypothetical protein
MSITFDTLSCQFSSVSPIMPAIRSTFVCGKPCAVIHSQARNTSGERCARPFASSTASLKFSTPRETRVTPISFSVRTFSSFSVPGSHSNVTSAALSQWTQRESRSCSCVSCREER